MTVRRGTHIKLLVFLQAVTAAIANPLLPAPPWEPDPPQQHGRDSLKQRSTNLSLNISTITGVPTTAFTSYQTGNLVRSTNFEPSNSTTTQKRATTARAVTTGENDSPPWNCTGMPVFTRGDVDDGGLGIQLTNADNTWRAFFVYHNLCDYIPYKYIWINANSTEFVSLPAGFEGRIVRGTDEWNLGGVPRPLGTWFEFALDNNSWIWGDVSLIRGCDGAVLMWALDNSGAWKGFTQWILDGAPPSAYDTKPSGAAVLGATEAWDGSTNAVPMAWEVQRVGANYAYVDDSHGNPVITSTNGRFATYWPAGRL